MTKVSAQQMTLSFEPGLTERHKTLLSVVRESIYRCRKPLKQIAADMDLSESSLSRKLSENDDDRRSFSVADLEAAIASANDLSPIHWLIEKHMEDPEQTKTRAANALRQALPEILALARQMGVRA